MQSIFEKLFDNLLIAAFIPSLAFFTVIVLAFGDLVPPPLIDKLRLIFVSRAILILTLATCTSFGLSYLSETVYHYYRGEPWKNSWLNFEKSKATKKKEKIARLKQEMIALLSKGDNKSEHVIKLQREYSKLETEYSRSYPPLENVLPTRLGNILASAEIYPYQQYKIDSGQMWTRLKHVIPAVNMTQIDQVNHEMSFLINSSLLSILLGLASWTGIIYVTAASLLRLLGFVETPQGIDVSMIYQFLTSLGLYLLLTVVFLGLGWFFYKISLPVAKRYAEMYRSAYDLFRFKLSEQLRFECPKSTEKEEQDHWDFINEFLTQQETGKILSPRPFKHEDDSNKGKAGSSKPVITFTLFE
jgi:hypothetical protein